MWEIEIFESGLMLGTFDFTEEPAIGIVYEEDLQVVEVLEIDPVAKTAVVRIDFA